MTCHVAIFGRVLYWGEMHCYDNKALSLCIKFVSSSFSFSESPQWRSTLREVMNRKTLLESSITKTQAYQLVKLT